VRRAAASVVAAGLLVAAAACTSDPERPAGGAAVSVVTTTTQLTDFARIVGGTHVTVYGVLKPNVDPHDYEPSPADLDALANADVIVKNGVGLESWFDDTITSAEPSGQIVDASAGVPIRDGDPHIWHDPDNEATMATNIERALEQADPAHAAAYEANLAAFTTQLDALDAANRSALGSLANKKVVTNHDALGYYLDHYGLELVGSIIPSSDTSAQLSAQDINDIVAKIRATGAKAVFSEASLPPETAEAIASEAGVQVVAGEGSLYVDALGPVGSDADTYLKMEAHNTKVIVDSLR
jgi:ABC-type Zn uptake system ZnuABC Zn-binding protein ZnuA